MNQALFPTRILVYFLSKDLKIDVYESDNLRVYSEQEGLLERFTYFSYFDDLNMQLLYHLSESNKNLIAEQVK